jgi:NitT/TauT family transport system substrate-binding protein
MRRYFVSKVVVAASISISLAACGSSASAPTAGEPRKVTVSVTHPEDLYGLPWEVGREKGFFKDAGIEIEQIIPSEGGGTTLQNVVSGRLPFGEVATGAIVAGFNEGAPIQVIGGGIQSVADVNWVSLKDSSLGDLKDGGTARWGFTNPGSVSEAMSFLTPEGSGLDAKSVTRTSTGGTGAGIALLEAGDIDIAYSSPRVALENAAKLKVVGSSADYVKSYQQTLIVSSRDFAAKNPETARGVLKGYADAVEWINTNPKEAAEFWSQRAGLGSDDAATILNAALAADHWGVAYNPEALRAAAKGLSYTKGLEQVDWKALLTDEYLPEGKKGTIP